MEKNDLPESHFNVWHALQSLEDGDRILGEDLMKRCGIKDKRNLYNVIEELRNNLFFVVGSKEAADRGYFEARTELDVSRMLRNMRKPALTQLELADKMEKEWLKRQYGQELESEGEDLDE